MVFYDTYQYPDRISDHLQTYKKRQDYYYRDKEKLEDYIFI